MFIDENSDESMDFTGQSDVPYSDAESEIVVKLSDSEYNNVSIESKDENRNSHVAGRSWKYIQLVSKTCTHNIVRNSDRPLVLAKNAKSNIDTFTLFIDDEIINIVITFSNHRCWGGGGIQDWNKTHHDDIHVIQTFSKIQNS